MESGGKQPDMISVIIPCYNVEKYIDRCMKSVLNQTYRNLEIILVDDGSTDGTGEIIKKYAGRDHRIRIIHQANRGAGAARNAGLEIAGGSYIGFVDSDDWIAEDMYEYLMGIIKDADIAVCDYIKANKYNLEKGNKKNCVSVLNHRELMKRFFRIHGEKSCYSVCNMLYKAETINGCRFPEGAITEDLLFNYRVYGNCGKTICSDKRMYYYFVNVDGVTRKALGKRDLALLENWDIIVEDIKRREPEFTKYALLNRWRADFTLLSKAFLYGYEKSEITETQLVELIAQVKEHRKHLMWSGMLDWKRKLLLVYVSVKSCI